MGDDAWQDVPSETIDLEKAAVAMRALDKLTQEFTSEEWAAYKDWVTSRPEYLRERIGSKELENLGPLGEATRERRRRAGE